MSLSPDELQSLLTNIWSDSLSPMTFQQVMGYRSTKLKRMDGKDLPKINMWPKNIRKIIFTTGSVPSYGRMTKLFLFFIGNGYSPLAAGSWILTYCGLSSWKKRENQARTRIKHLCKIYRNLKDSGNELYYWDVRLRRTVKVTQSTHC